MYQLVLIIHVLVAICIIALVLVQQGRGASIGAAFGSGASQTVFGSRGSGSFLLRVTIGFAAVFFMTGLTLNHLATKAVAQQNQLQLPIPLGQQETGKTNPNNIPMMPGLQLPSGKK
jgi:preprotein translocase subunit SecG